MLKRHLVHRSRSESLWKLFLRRSNTQRIGIVKLHFQRYSVIKIPLVELINFKFILIKRECPARKFIYPCTCGRYDESNNIYLNCNNQNLKDEETNRILDVFLNNNSGVAYPPIGALGLGENHLTKVPHQIPFFSQLSDINLSSNNITTIPTGSFNFNRTLGRLFLGSNSLLKIEPSAFLGTLIIVSLLF